MATGERRPVRLVGRTSRRSHSSQVSVPLTVLPGSGRQPNHIIYQPANRKPSIVAAITAAREVATRPAASLIPTPQPLSQTFHRRARKGRKGPPGFNHLGPCPRSLRSGRALRVGGRRAAPGRKCSGLRYTFSPAVPLDIGDFFACFASFAVQMHFLGLWFPSSSTRRGPSVSGGGCPTGSGSLQCPQHGGQAREVRQAVDPAH